MKKSFSDHNSQKTIPNNANIVPDEALNCETGAPWAFPESVYSGAPENRLKALFQEAQKQIEAGRHRLARITLMRVAKGSGWGEMQVVQRLVELLKLSGDIAAIKEVWKRASVAALRRGDYNSFLSLQYISTYSEKMFSKDPDYSQSWIDEDFHAFTQLAAIGHPLNSWVKQHRKPLNKPSRHDQIRIGFALEGFSKLQAPIQRYRTIAKYYDRSKYKLAFYSRLPLTGPAAEQQGYAFVASEFAHHGCRAICPSQALRPIEEVGFLAESIVRDEIDILFYMTVYFVPQLNFLSWLQPAPYQAATCHQQPEYTWNMDASFVVKTLIPDQVGHCLPGLMTVDKDHSLAAHKRSDFGIPSDAVILVSANRDIKYRNQKNQDMWEAVNDLLARHENAYFLPLGLENGLDSIPVADNIKARVLVLGFREDMVRFLKMADIYLDNFMHTSSAVMDAAFDGLPVVTITRPRLAEPFSVRDSDLSSNLLPVTELLIPEDSKHRWHQVMDRLITDQEYRKHMGEIHRDFASRFEPQEAVETFLQRLCKGMNQKYQMNAQMN